MQKNPKRLTDKQVLMKDFTKKVMQLVKPINYWGFPANAVKIIWLNLLNHRDILYFKYLILYVLHNYISRVESNIFDIYSKIGDTFFGSNF